jgi:homoserine dehydrogenase
LDARAAADALAKDGNLHGVPGVRREPVPLETILKETPVDFVCDATPTNYETGQPSLGILQTALRCGANAVTCSKGGVGKDLHGLKKLAEENCVSMRFESSVLSGTPLIDLVRGPLAGCDISRVEGIVNGTTNYILTRMEEGMGYGEALAEAQRLGYAEADPTGDVEGFDAAIKVCIMAAEFFGFPLAIGDVDRTGIANVTAAEVAAAKADGKRIKLIAGVERADGGVRGYVRPTAIPLSHPLAGVAGVTNAATIATDNLGEITIVGPGAGARETAQGLLSDMLELARGL